MPALSTREPASPNTPAHTSGLRSFPSLARALAVERARRHTLRLADSAREEEAARARPWPAGLPGAEAMHPATPHDDAAQQLVLETLRVRYESLTLRERDIMSLVADGLLNKQIAARLDLAERTVKAHRARVTAKMGATSIAHLVRMADRLGLCGPFVLEPLDPWR